MSNNGWTAEEIASGGNWETSILGSIATNLTQLRTWDQAVKELVQNADDAQATEVLFTITNEGITVSNDQLLSQCQFPNESSSKCGLKGKTKNSFCDVHAIKTLSSQNKSDNPEATGKFGIGFVSVFLFTDSPSISSGNGRMLFQPTENKVPFKTVNSFQKGTVLNLPWAKDPNSEVRLRIEKSAIESNQIPGISTEIIESCRRSFIFVRNLKKITVVYNEKTKLNLTRHKNENEIKIIDTLNGESTSWELLKSTNEMHLKLEELRASDIIFSSRRVEFEILIPKKVDNSFRGLLYATLATNQRTYLPFHINADFYPDTSRNNLTFSDRGNERDPAALWNRSIISQCAKFVGSRISEIHETLGNDVVWEILKSSFSIHRKRTGENAPECLNDFWLEVSKAAATVEIVEDQFGNLLEISYQRVIETNYLEICKNLGSKEINQHTVATALVNVSARGNVDEILTNSDMLSSLYCLIDFTIQNQHEVIDELQLLPIWLTSEKVLLDLPKVKSIPKHFDKKTFSLLFPSCPISSETLENFELIKANIEKLTSNKMIFVLSTEVGSKDFLENSFFANNPKSAYEYLLKILDYESVSAPGLEALRKLSIWPHSNGKFLDLISSTLPGSFVDPIGIGKLLNPEMLGVFSSRYMTEKLDVKELSLELYVTEQLPQYLDHSELSIQQAENLTVELIDHQESINASMFAKVQTLKIIVTERAKICKPSEVIFTNEMNLKLFSASDFDFVDLKRLEERVPEKDKRIESFLRKSGLIFDPNFDLLISSWDRTQEGISKSKSDVERVTNLSEAMLDLWQKKTKLLRSAEPQPKTKNLRWPCTNSCKEWHYPSDLIQSKWSKAICMKENSHEVGVNFGKRTRESIQELFGIASKPAMYKLDEHLEHCTVERIHPGEDFYKLLNWLSSEGEDQEKSDVSDLRDKPLIFHEGDYWIPRDIYIDIPRNLQFLSDFVHFVQKSPKGMEGLWTSLGIGRISESDVPRYLPAIKLQIMNSKNSEDINTKYLSALSIIGNAYTSDEDWALNYLSEFKDSELLQTLSGHWVKPSQGVIADNDEWANALQEYFGDYLLQLEAVSFNFVIAAGSVRLTEALTVHEESLVIDGSGDQLLTSNFQSRFEGIYALLANQIIDSVGGSMQVYERAIPRLEKLRNMDIFPVANVEVKVSLLINGESRSKDVTHAPSLYLSKSNAVIFVKSAREDILTIFTAIIFEFIPRLMSGQVLDSVTKFLVVMKESPDSLMEWLGQNGYLKHDITPPKSLELIPDVIDLGISDVAIDIEQEEVSSESVESNTDEDSFIEAEEDQSKIDIYSMPTPRNSHGPSDSGDAKPKRTRAENTEQVDRDSEVKRKVSVEFEESSDSSDENQNFEPNTITNPSKNPRSGQPFKSEGSGKRRRSGFIHVEAEKGDGSAYVRNSEVDAAGIEWVKRKEWEIDRTVTDMNDSVRNHKGFDLKSVSNSDPSDIRLIEVKSCSGFWPDLGVGLSRPQFQVSILEGYKSWLYVVENALAPETAMRLHRIQDPWSKIRSVYFDLGWRDLAEVSVQQNPIVIAKGMRVRHESDGFGWIASDPVWQGQAISLVVNFDRTSQEKKIRWDDRYIEVVTGTDDGF